MKTVIDKQRTVHLANTKPGRESGYVAIEKQIWFCFDPFLITTLPEYLYIHFAQVDKMKNDYARYVVKVKLEILLDLKKQLSRQVEVKGFSLREETRGCYSYPTIQLEWSFGL